MQIDKYGDQVLGAEDDWANPTVVNRDQSPLISPTPPVAPARQPDRQVRDDAPYLGGTALPTAPFAKDRVVGGIGEVANADSAIIPSAETLALEATNPTREYARKGMYTHNLLDGIVDPEIQSIIQGKMGDGLRRFKSLQSDISKNDVDFSEHVPEYKRMMDTLVPQRDFIVKQETDRQQAEANMVVENEVNNRAMNAREDLAINAQNNINAAEARMKQEKHALDILGQRSELAGRGVPTPTNNETPRNYAGQASLASPGGSVTPFGVAGNPVVAAATAAGQVLQGATPSPTTPPTGGPPIEGGYADGGDPTAPTDGNYADKLERNATPLERAAAAQAAGYGGVRVPKDGTDPNELSRGEYITAAHGASFGQLGAGSKPEEIKAAGNDFEAKVIARGISPSNAKLLRSSHENAASAKVALDTATQATKQATERAAAVKVTTDSLDKDNAALKAAQTKQDDAEHKSYTAQKEAPMLLADIAYKDAKEAAKAFLSKDAEGGYIDDSPEASQARQQLLQTQQAYLKTKAAHTNAAAGIVANKVDIDGYAETAKKALPWLPLKDPAHINAYIRSRIRQLADEDGIRLPKPKKQETPKTQDTPK